MLVTEKTEENCHTKKKKKKSVVGDQTIIEASCLLKKMGGGLALQSTVSMKRRGHPP